jgi:hypothetical protein
MCVCERERVYACGRVATLHQNLVRVRVRVCVCSVYARTCTFALVHVCMYVCESVFILTLQINLAFQLLESIMVQHNTITPNITKQQQQH